MRITGKRLATRFATLAEIMGWDTKSPCWTPRPGGGNQARVGYTFLEHSCVYGYSVNQIVNDVGAEHRLKESCSASEMSEWLGGAIFAADRMRRPESQGAAATAPLTAAAPELLAALIRLRDCPDVQMDCTEAETDAARLQANEAIKRATRS